MFSVCNSCTDTVPGPFGGAVAKINVNKFQLPDEKENGAPWELKFGQEPKTPQFCWPILQQPLFRKEVAPEGLGRRESADSGEGAQTAEVQERLREERRRRRAEEQRRLQELEKQELQGKQQQEHRARMHVEESKEQKQAPLTPLHKAEQEALDRKEEAQKREKLLMYLASQQFPGVNESKKVSGLLTTGFTYPLHWATKAQDAEAVEMLLVAGADRTLLDSSNLTALALAKRLNKRESHKAIIELLSA